MTLVFHSALLLTLMMGPHAQPAPEPPSNTGIYAIIVADELSGPAGTGMNRRGMSTGLESLREAGIEVEVIVLDAQEMSPGHIIGRIRSLPADRLATRTLVFYYAGHGATDARFGHFMSTPSGPLFRSTLEAEIQAKAPALAVILTDCCSTQARSRFAAVPAPGPMDRRVARNLFLQHKGFVDINACSNGQAAFYSPDLGGMFTRAFTRLIEPKGGDKLPADVDPDQDGFVTWQEAYKQLVSWTNDGYTMFRQDVLSPNSNLTVANANDWAMIQSQITQDPQVFGELAKRSDQKTPPPPAVNRKARFGAMVEETMIAASRGLRILSVTPGMPASRVMVIKPGGIEEGPVTMVPNDTILTANGVRILTRDDLFEVIDRIPAGGQLMIEGTDGSRPGAKYRAKVTLD